NTVPMMTGHGQFGPIGMGGMFSVLKVRKDQKPGDYSDPGPYQFPPGTVAREWTGETPTASRQSGAPAAQTPAPSKASAVKRHNHGMSH
ncbi:MAG: hypothetical protein RL758_2527, partial [Pseudomonadota bacterium]